MARSEYKILAIPRKAGPKNFVAGAKFYFLNDGATAQFDVFDSLDSETPLVQPIITDENGEAAIYIEQDSNINVEVSGVSSYQEFVPLPPPVDYGGQSWGPVGPAGLNSGAGTTSAVSAIASDGAETWVVGFVGGWASISTDGGLTFSGLARGLNSGSTTDTINSIAYGNGVWVAGMDSGWASYSYNVTDWFPLPRWLNSGASLSTRHITSIRFYGGAFLACVSSHGLAGSTYGVSWSAVYSDQAYTEVAGSAAGWVARAGSWDSHTASPLSAWPSRRYRLGLGVTMSDSGGIDISDSGVVITGTSQNSRFFMSSDAGATYVELTAGLGGPVSSQTGPVVWAGGNTWIASHSVYSMITTDGTTWAQLPDHLNMTTTSNPNYIGALATNKSGVWLAGGIEGRLSRSPPLP